MPDWFEPLGQVIAFIGAKGGAGQQSSRQQAQHLLLALVDQPEGLTPRLLERMDVDLARLRADALVRGVAATVGGKGGGRPHLAQAGLADIDRLSEALGNVPEVVRGLLAEAAA